VGATVLPWPPGWHWRFCVTWLLLLCLQCAVVAARVKKVSPGDSFRLRESFSSLAEGEDISEIEASSGPFPL